MSTLPRSSTACRSAPGDPPVGDLDGRLDQRQRERLHAVAEQRQVAALDLEEPRVEGGVVEVDVRTHEVAEAILGVDEEVLAVPEGVVAVERDDLDHPCPRSAAHAAAWRPSSVVGGPSTNGQISSEMRRQLAVARELAEDGVEAEVDALDDHEGRRHVGGLQDLAVLAAVVEEAAHGLRRVLGRDGADLVALDEVVEVAEVVHHLARR